MDALKQGSDALFILLGGIMVLAMHAGFAFLELGTVRKKNQVNALVKISARAATATARTAASRRIRRPVFPFSRWVPGF